MVSGQGRKAEAKSETGRLEVEEPVEPASSSYVLTTWAALRDNKSFSSESVMVLLYSLSVFRAFLANWSSFVIVVGVDVVTVAIVVVASFIAGIDTVLMATA